MKMNFNRKTISVLRLLWVFVLVIQVCFLSGCAKLMYLRQLLTIKAYSDNKDYQVEYVKTQNENFGRLLEVVDNNQVDEYKTKQDFMDAFGEPVYARAVEVDGHVVEEWVYRLAKGAFKSDKILLSFDDNNSLVKVAVVKQNNSSKKTATQE